LMTGIIRPDVTEFENLSVSASYDVALTSLDGESLTLERFRGKTIFINVWASWCPPCLAELPLIQKLYDSLRDEDIEFVLISTDESAEIARSYLERSELTLPAYMLSGSLPEPYASSVLPTTYVVSPSGQLVARHAGMANYDSDEFRSFLRGLVDSNKDQRSVAGVSFLR
jgi:thiol-disulfide isomerase/thioredoxin